MRKLIAVITGLLLTATLLPATNANATPPSEVQDSGAFVVGIQPDGSEVFLGGKVPQTTTYPIVGPYMTQRWHDAYKGYTVLGIPTSPGHPYTCIDVAFDLDNYHQFARVAQEYDQYEFIVEYSFAGCGSVGDRYKISAEFGGRRDTCTHTYWAWETIGGVTYVKRSIEYFDHLIAAYCFGDAEINNYRTSRAIGTALGLKPHHGDGSPSIFAYDIGQSPYIWPQAYDRRTIQYYN